VQNVLIFCDLDFGFDLEFMPALCLLYACFMPALCLLYACFMPVSSGSRQALNFRFILRCVSKFF